AADVGGVGAALGVAARRRVVVPGPARRHADLDLHAATGAGALGPGGPLRRLADLRLPHQRAPRPPAGWAAIQAPICGRRRTWMSALLRIWASAIFTSPCASAGMFRAA